MDLLTLRRLAAEWTDRARGSRFGGLRRLDPRRVALRLGSEAWALLMDENACGVFPAAGAEPLKGLPTSLEYLDDALTGWQAGTASAEPGQLRLVGETPAGPLELRLVGPPRSFLLALRENEVLAGYRRPLDRPWETFLPVFDPLADDGPPREAALEAWARGCPEALRTTALARLSRALTVPLAREVRRRAGSDQPPDVARAAAELLAEAGGSGPVWVYPAGEHPALVSVARLSHMTAGPSSAPTVLDALAELDRGHLEPARLAIARRSAARGAQARAARAERTLEKLSTEAVEADGARAMERAAHTLMAHGARLPRGRSEAVLPDLEDPMRQLTIALDPTRTGMENATAMLKRATRLARRSEMLEARRATVQVELHAARSEATETLERAGWPALDAAGVLEEERGAEPREPSRKAAGKAGRGSDPEAGGGEISRVTSEEGWAVLVGRNDRQNDYLTHHLARPGDLWFHAEHVPGSHVVLRRDSQPGDPSRKTLEEVAGYAAWMSKARNSSRAPVIMAEKRHVRRARGGPGKVSVERGKSLIVKPRKPGG